MRSVRSTGRPPTLEDVARAAGVSRATVSRVINGVNSVDPQLRAAVEEAVARTGYVPNHAARALVTRRTGSVALVVAEAPRRGVAAPFVARLFTDPHFGRLVTGLRDGLAAAGQHLVIMLADDGDAREQVVRYLRQGHVDGVVLVTTDPTDRLPEQLAAAAPTVVVGNPGRPLPVSYVEVAQRAGAALAADRFAALGRRRVVVIGGPQGMPAARERLDGFRTAMARHGQFFVPAAEGDFTVASGARAMRSLLAEHPGLDGVFAANDLMAQGALPVLAEAGRAVPDQVAVIGFDDSSAALDCRPALTTVRHPVEDMAAEAARLLLAHVDDPSQPPTTRLFQPSLVVRASA